MLIFDQKTLYSLCALCFFTYYFPKQKFQVFITKTFDIFNFFKLFSSLMSSNVMADFDDTTDLINENTDLIDDNKNQNFEPAPEFKYEDKFLDDIRKLNKEFVFDEKEEELERTKFDEIFLLAQKDYTKKVNEVKDEIWSLEKEIEIQKSGDDFFNVEYNENPEEEDKDTIKSLTEEKVRLEKALSELLNNPQDIDNLRLESRLEARKFVIDERLDKLKNSFVMEKTPLGNVLMLYNNKRGSFEFYSDNTIPYRYLEPVSRKYVKTFGCRPIYCDMEEELKNYEKKLEEKEREKEELDKRILEEKKVLDEKNISVAEPKKNVFAKFKSYNKEAGTGHVNTAAPPKNSIPNNKVTENNTNEKVLLKENANRYSYEGKLSNFNFLKKVDRKVVDKKFAMTFADFKRLQEERKNNKTV